MDQLLLPVSYISQQFWSISVLAPFYREYLGTELLDLWPWVRSVRVKGTI